MILYDRHGNPRTWQWLVSQFGPLEVVMPDIPPAYQLIAIHERDDIQPNTAHTDAAATPRTCAGTSVIVTVLDADDHPVDQLPVCWSWPDAPALDDSGWLPRGVVGHTNSNGHVGFPMGGGAYYTPPSRGPHQVWIKGPNQSCLVDGLGMIAGTNHRHLDLTFQQVPSEPTEPPIEPPPQDPTITVIKEIRLRLADIDHLLETYLDHLVEEQS